MLVGHKQQKIQDLYQQRELGLDQKWEMHKVEQQAQP